MSTTDLLFELGTEELPAGEIDSMVTALYEGILNGLKDEGLPFADAQYFSTPRRLAVLVREVAVKGPDIQRSVVGPPLSAAQDSEVSDTARLSLPSHAPLSQSSTKSDPSPPTLHSFRMPIPTSIHPDTHLLAMCSRIGRDA